MSRGTVIQGANEGGLAAQTGTSPQRPKIISGRGSISKETDNGTIIEPDGEGPRRGWTIIRGTRQVQILALKRKEDGFVRATNAMEVHLDHAGPPKEFDALPILLVNPTAPGEIEKWTPIPGSCEEGPRSVVPFGCGPVNQCLTGAIIESSSSARINVTDYATSRPF